MRELSPAFLELIERSSSDVVPIWFATITYDDLEDPIRVCSDNLTVDGEAGKYILRDEEFTCCPFNWRRLTDGEGFPRATLEIQNIDRKIGEIAKRLTESPRFDILLTEMGEFDVSVHPRIPLDEPYIEYEANFMRLENVKGDEVSVTADVKSYDYTTEPWPCMTVHIALLPGAYR